MALVLCFSAFLWIAPQVQAEELDISGANVTGFALTGDSPKINDGKLEGGSIGVFVTSSSDRFQGSNIKWDYDSDGWLRDADSAMVRFKDNGNDQKIAAYYPYTSTLTDGKVQIELPEAYDTEYEKYDYLYGEYAALSNNPATITLNHLMSKVVVTVDSTMGTEIDSSDTVAGITLLNVPRTADWTVPTAALSNFGSNGNISLYDGEDKYYGYALPNGAETLTLLITMTSGRVFTATASLDDATTTDKTEALESGVLYNLGVKVGKDKVEISTISVTDWKDGGTIDGTTATEAEIGIEMNGTTATLTVPSYATDVMVEKAIKKVVAAGVTTIIVSGNVSQEYQDAIKAGSSGAAVYFKDLTTNNYISSTGLTFSCTLCSESDGKYVLLTEKAETFTPPDVEALETLKETQLEAVGATRYPAFDSSKAEYAKYESYALESLSASNGNEEYISLAVNSAGEYVWLWKDGPYLNVILEDISTVYADYNIKACFYYIFEVPVS